MSAPTGQYSIGTNQTTETYNTVEINNTKSLQVINNPTDTARTNNKINLVSLRFTTLINS
jgi:hypothetical protein